MGSGVPAGSPEWSWNAAWDECHGVEREVRAKVCGVPRCRGVLRASPQCSRVSASAFYGYGYEDCRGHPGAPPIRYHAHSTLSGSTVGRYVLVWLCHSLPRAPPVRRAAACLES